MIMALPDQANGVPDGFGKGVPPSGYRMGSRFVVRWHRTGIGVVAEGSVPTYIPPSSLHRDPLTGFLFQVIGRKRLDLYSADQEELI